MTIHALLCLAHLLSVDVLSVLESVPPIPQPSSFSAKIALPPSRSISLLWPGAHQLVALPQDCQVHIADLSQSATMALVLVQAIVHTAKHTHTVSRSILAIRKIPNAAWALDCCSRILRCMKVSKSLGQTLVKYDRVLSTLFQTVGAVLQFNSPAAGSAHEHRRCVLASMIIYSTSLSFLHSMSSSHIQQELARSLMTAYGLLCGFPQLTNDWDAYLAPAVHGVALNPVLFGTLFKDLQVRRDFPT